MNPAFFVHEGHGIDYTPSTDVAAGSVVVLGECVGIAVQPIAAGRTGTLTLEGVFDVPIEEVGSWTLGALAYWDGADFATQSSQNHKLLGKVVGLNPRPGGLYVRIRLQS